MKRILILFLLLIIPLSVNAKSPKGHIFYEKEYQNHCCSLNNGTVEYRLPDKARVDCVTDNYAVEFDFTNKWAEAIGQALFYANELNKKPGIVLISEKGNKDLKYINRVKKIADKFGITVWIIKPEDLKK